PGLGSVLARTRGPGPSPSLTGFTSGVSPGGLKFGLRPLRLPISPPGQNGEAIAASLSQRHRVAHYRAAWISLLVHCRKGDIIHDLPGSGNKCFAPALEVRGVTPDRWRPRCWARA